MTVVWVPYYIEEGDKVFAWDFASTDSEQHCKEQFCLAHVDGLAELEEWSYFDNHGWRIARFEEVER